jgi:hypothetical protein
MIILRLAERMQHVRQVDMKRALRLALQLLQSGQFDTWLTYPEYMQPYLKKRSAKDMDALRYPAMGEIARPRQAETVMEYLLEKPVREIRQAFESIPNTIHQNRFGTFVYGCKQSLKRIEQERRDRRQLERYRRRMAYRMWRRTGRM